MYDYEFYLYLYIRSTNPHNLWTVSLYFKHSDVDILIMCDYNFEWDLNFMDNVSFISRIVFAYVLYYFWISDPKQSWRLARCYFNVFSARNRLQDSMLRFTPCLCFLFSLFWFFHTCSLIVIDLNHDAFSLYICRG